jgi:hypothetical protein
MCYPLVNTEIHVIQSWLADNYKIGTTQVCVLPMGEMLPPHQRIEMAPIALERVPEILDTPPRLMSNVCCMPINN